MRMGRKRVESYPLCLAAGGVENGMILTFSFIFLQSESSHTGFKTFRIVLYGLITVFAIATLGISAA